VGDLRRRRRAREDLRRVRLRTERAQHLFFPAMAVEGRDGRWEVEVHAWCFRMRARRLVIPLARKLVGLERTRLTPSQKALCAERARWLFVDDKRGRSVSVASGGLPRVLGRTGANGRLRAAFTLETRPAEGHGVQCAVTPRRARQSAAWERLDVHCLERDGVSVVSDIDDTIRVSHVGDRDALLRTTFLERFKPVDGMAEVFRAWAERSGARFHYVSATPWQLYVPLAGFIEAHGFPRGTVHLKDFRWRDRTFFNLFAPPDRFKLASMAALLNRLPGRRFVLVGDSSERDPEVFGQLARDYPAQVRKIFIRSVGGAAVDERCRAAFAGVRADVWSTFSDPAMLPRRVS